MATMTGAAGGDACAAALDKDACSDWDAFSDDMDSASVASVSGLSEGSTGGGGASTAASFGAPGEGASGGARRSREASLFGVAEKREPAPFRCAVVFRQCHV